jgi:hypothetical protein
LVTYQEEKEGENKKAALGLDIGRIHPPRTHDRRRTLLPPSAACSFAHMVRSSVVAKLQEDIDAVTNETRYGSGRVRT